MIVKQEKKGNVTIYYVDKDFDDDKLTNIMNTHLKRQQIQHIICQTRRSVSQCKRNIQRRR